MNIDIVFLRYNSGPEAIIGGMLSWIVLIVIISIFKSAKKAIKGKEFDEVNNDNP
jgi:hypothetical protein